MSVVIMLCQKDLTQQCIFSLLSNMAQGQLHLLLFINCDKNECLCACPRLNSTSMLSIISAWPPRGLHNTEEKHKLYISAFHFLFLVPVVFVTIAAMRTAGIDFLLQVFMITDGWGLFPLHVWQPTAHSVRYELIVLSTMLSAQQQKETQNWPHQLCLNSAFTFRLDFEENLQEHVGPALSVNIKMLVLR